MQNLTELEQLAIDAAFNLTDGHPRQTLTTSQATIVQRLPVLFAEAAVRPLADLEYECKESFFSPPGSELSITWRCSVGDALISPEVIVERAGMLFASLANYDEERVVLNGLRHDYRPIITEGLA